MELECPYLAGVSLKFCETEREVYVPSISEMREHCKHLQHRLCRRYLLSDVGAGTTKNVQVYSDNARHAE